MAAPIDTAVFKDGMIVLATAAVLVPLARRAGITPVVTFLAAGAVLGPFGLAALADYLPALAWISISRSDGLGIVGELGVVALLFLIGIELSFQRLMTMRRLVFGLGGLQILIAAARAAAPASISSGGGEATCEACGANCGLGAGDGDAGGALTICRGTACQLCLHLAQRTLRPEAGMAPSGILNFASHAGQTRIISTPELSSLRAATMSVTR